MLARWCIAVMLGCGSSTATTTATPREVDNTGVAATSAVVEGYVRDSRTGATVPGVEVEVWLGALDHGRTAAWAISDERGFFSLDVEPGTGSGFLLAQHGEHDNAPSLELRAGARIRIDVTVDHDALADWRARFPPDACPSSPAGTIIEGHTTTQQDLDDLARTVLERSLTDPSAIPALGIAGRGPPIAVRIEVGPRKHLSARALPSSRFVLKTLAELQAEASRSNKRVGYIELQGVYSNGSCAILDVGGDFVSPSPKPFEKRCCCVAHDIYEKRRSRWVFARRLLTSCA